MATSYPYKFYNFNGDISLLPGTNTPHGATEIDFGSALSGQLSKLRSVRPATDPDLLNFQNLYSRYQSGGLMDADFSYLSQNYWRDATPDVLKTMATGGQADSPYSNWQGAIVNTNLIPELEAQGATVQGGNVVGAAPQVPAGSPGAMLQSALAENPNLTPQQQYDASLKGTPIPGTTPVSPDQMIDQEMLNAGQLPSSIENMGEADLNKLFESLNSPQGSGANLASLFGGAQDQGVQKAQQQSLAIQKQLNDFYGSFEAGQDKIEGQTIPMDFIQGQQAGLQKQAQRTEANLLRSQQLAQTQLGFAQEAADKRFQLQLEEFKYQREAPQRLLNMTQDYLNIQKMQKELGAGPGYGPGIIGEYQYAKEQGFEGSFNQYQNLDANRKAQSTNGVTDAINLMRLQLMQSELVNGKPPTDAQRTLGSYASRLEQSIPILEKLTPDIQGMNLLSFEAQLKLPAALQTSEMQQYMQSARNLINSILRRESGAVIAPSEFAEARQQYLPQPGDSDAVLTQKKANRDLQFATYRAGAGNAYQSIESLIGGNTTNNQTSIINDIQSAIKDPQHFPNRESLIPAIASEYGLSQDEASKYVYQYWGDNAGR